MDVPFISSGATSRVHYTLVRKVESADTTQLADRYILAEVQSIRHRLGHPALSLKERKECLIMLLYCSVSVASGLLNLDFALPHAVNLAEAGHALQDKRIGYLFCNEIMPLDHELQLMLVNTLRKDIDSSSMPRICLALDTLITSSVPEVIPAVQSRLHDLLSHNSLQVRRRAILAFRALSRHDPEFLKTIASNIQKSLQDSQSTVVAATLIASCDLVKTNSSSRNIVRSIVTEILLSVWSETLTKPKYCFILNILQALRIVGLSNEHLHIVHRIIRFASRSGAHALLYGSFLFLSDLPSEALNFMQTSSRLSPVHIIRHLLTSRDPNEQYLFLSCLECLDPMLWAGTTLETPAVLEGWEVEKVMQFLDSPDRLIRKKTLRILCRIDMNLVESYYTQSFQALPRAMSLKDRNELTARLLEVLEIQHFEDGEMYARQLKALFGIVDDPPSGESHRVLEKVVEMVLLYIRNSTTEFRIGCVTTLVASVVELDTHIGSTFMVIVSALASEFCGRLSIPPIDILHGLASRLSSYSPAVQEACLLSMLRIVANCDEAPPNVIATVTNLGEFAGRHIRRRCDQFVTLCDKKKMLVEIITRAQSPTLPDFLEALEIESAQPPQTTGDTCSPNATPSHSPKPLPSPRPLAGSKLRYAPYEPPRHVARLRRPSETRRSSGSQSAISDSGELSRFSSRFSGSSERRHSLDELSRTVTAGDLALAVGEIKLEMMTKVSSNNGDHSHQPAANMIMDDLIPRTDLIALDSPFISDLPHSSAASQDSIPDFESTWDALESSNARGWCESSTDIVVRRLQGLELNMKVIAIDHPPFKGELKVLLSEGVTEFHAALRLRDSEDDSCLWRLRCNDDRLRTRIKRLLTET